jgi:hypothetical protein
MSDLEALAFVAGVAVMVMLALFDLGEGPIDAPSCSPLTKR